MGKPKVAFYWCASCGGCEEAVVDLAEDTLKVVEAVEFVFWPVAMDAKYKDVEAMEDGSILLTLFNGGIRNDENEHIAKLLRQKSKILVAFGSCACEGCIPGLANLSPAEMLCVRSSSVRCAASGGGVRSPVRPETCRAKVLRYENGSDPVFFESW